MSSLEAMLRSHPSARNLTALDLSLVARAADLLELPQGSSLYSAGQEIQHVDLLIDGSLSLVFSDPHGNEFTLECLGAGSHFGVLSLTQAMTAPMRVAAESDCRILRFSSATVRKLGTQVPLWKRNLIHSLGSRLRANFSAESLRPRSRTIAFLHLSDASRGIARVVAQRLQACGSKVTCLTDELVDLGEVDTRAFDHSQLVTSQEQHEQMVEADPSGDRTLMVDVSLTELTPAGLEFTKECNSVYWLAPVSVRADDVQQIRSLDPHATHHRWVWCLAADEPVLPGSCQVRQSHLRQMVALLVSSSGRARLERQAIERIVHDARGVCVGLALGGGAARGMAHLGVLSELESAGVVVDVISGTSVGAMVGVLYAAGLDPMQLAEYFATDLTPSRLEQSLPAGGSFYLLRKYRRGQWDSMLRNYLADWDLSQLLIPATTVTVDLVAGQQVTRRDGDAVKAILESINLPGLSPPICRDGMALIDGGVLNVLPADVLVSGGCDYVIGVDVGAHGDNQFAGNRPDTPTEEMQTPSVFQTMVRAIEIQHRNMRSIGADAADFTIEPDVSQVDPADFLHAQESAEMGAAAARQALPQLLSELSTLDASFPRGS